MSTDSLAVSGVIPPVVTAFDREGELDEAATVAHAEFVLEGGASGVFALGTNGEFPLLTADERQRVISALATGIDAPVLAGVGHPSTRATVAEAHHAERAGVAGVVVVTPSYYPVDDRGLIAHYRAVTEAVEVPVYAYNIPSRTGNALSLDALAELADLSWFAGFKDSSKDVPWLAQAVDAHPGLTALVGSDSLLLSGLDLGCDGVVSAVANVFPELVSELYAAHRAGDRELARKRQSEVFEIRRALKAGPYLAGVKTALALRAPGFDVGGLRAPLRTMDEGERNQLEATFRELGVL